MIGDDVDGGRVDAGLLRGVVGLDRRVIFSSKLISNLPSSGLWRERNHIRTGDESWYNRRECSAWRKRNLSWRWLVAETTAKISLIVKDS